MLGENVYMVFSEKFSCHFLCLATLETPMSVPLWHEHGAACGTAPARRRGREKKNSVHCLPRLNSILNGGVYRYVINRTHIRVKAYIRHASCA